jgi:ATP-dependent Lon protease
LETFVGKPKFSSDRLYEVSPPGVVTGLAWSSLGGSLIWIETVLVHQKKAGLKTTGKLGKVMQESIEIAQTVAKKFLNELEPSNTFFDQVSQKIS